MSAAEEKELIINLLGPNLSYTSRYPSLSENRSDLYLIWVGIERFRNRRTEGTKKNSTFPRKNLGGNRGLESPAEKG